MNTDLKLKTINDLLKYHFIIPSYQRGYRWEERQVNDLLEDLADFFNKQYEDEFYCLQPIVIKKEESAFRLVDGQQRLTTLYLILKYFNEAEFKTAKSIYTLTFNSREETTNYLNAISRSAYLLIIIHYKYQRKM